MHHLMTTTPCVICWLVWLCGSGAQAAERVAPDEFVLQNKVGVAVAFQRGPGGYAFGALSCGGKPVETAPRQGMVLLHETAQPHRQHWLRASQAEVKNDQAVEFRGQGQIQGVGVQFSVTLEVPPQRKAIKVVYEVQASGELPCEILMPFHAAPFQHAWTAHLYPWKERAKSLDCVLEKVGVPSLLLYRDDRSLGVLYGFDPYSEYEDYAYQRSRIVFEDGKTPACFSSGTGTLKPGVSYRFPMQIILSDAGDSTGMIIELVDEWRKLNGFFVDGTKVRTNDEAWSLFLAPDGRAANAGYQKGIGYQVDEQWTAVYAVYLLNAYVDYRLYEMTDNPLWRTRAIEQCDFTLRGQVTDEASPFYGAFRPWFSFQRDKYQQLGWHNTHRRGNPPESFNLNHEAFAARHLLRMWDYLKRREGIDREDWHRAALRAMDWVLRQQNPEGSFPQEVNLQEVRKSGPFTPGVVLLALEEFAERTGAAKYHEAMLKAEQWTYENNSRQFYFHGSHSDLPAHHIEEASVIALVEYWLNRFEKTGRPEYLVRARADMSLALLWWVPKQWSADCAARRDMHARFARSRREVPEDIRQVLFPTQGITAEQEAYPMYCSYSYFGNKHLALERLSAATGDPLYRRLSTRLFQNNYYNLETRGDWKGAVNAGAGMSEHHYLGHSVSDLMNQMIEVYFSGSRVRAGVRNKVYPDGLVYYDRDRSRWEEVPLTVRPSSGFVFVDVEAWDAPAGRRRWAESPSGPVTTQHAIGGLSPGKVYRITVDGSVLARRPVQKDGKLTFAHTSQDGKRTQFEVHAD